MTKPPVHLTTSDVLASAFLFFWFISLEIAANLNHAFINQSTCYRQLAFCVSREKKVWCIPTIAVVCTSYWYSPPYHPVSYQTVDLDLQTANMQLDSGHNDILAFVCDLHSASSRRAVPSRNVMIFAVSISRNDLTTTSKLLRSLHIRDFERYEAVMALTISWATCFKYLH